MHDAHAQHDLDRTLDAVLARWRLRDFYTPSDKQGIFDRRHQVTRLKELLSTLAAEHGEKVPLGPRVDGKR